MSTRQDVGAGASVIARGKRPVTGLAGPYGHPIHPMLVPLPIGVWVASLVFDIASRATDSRVLAEGAYWLVGLGVLGALLAALFGFMDLLSIPRGTKAFKTGLTHMSMNLTVTALFAVSFFIRLADDGYKSPTSIGLIVLSIIALLVLAVSGWLGGTMSYHYGVRVADEGTQSEAFARRAG